MLLWEKTKYAITVFKENWFLLFLKKFLIHLKVRAPFFLTVLTSSFLILLHPILYTVLNLSEIWNTRNIAFDHFGTEREFLKKPNTGRLVLLFCSLYIGTNSLFISSLRFISNTQAATFLATDPAFCFCLAFCLLGATCQKDNLLQNLGMVFINFQHKGILILSFSNQNSLFSSCCFVFLCHCYFIYKHLPWSWPPERHSFQK